MRDWLLLPFYLVISGVIGLGGLFAIYWVVWTLGSIL